MPQTLIRIIYDKVTLAPKRFVIPDDDSQLDKYHLPDIGEGSLDITNETWSTMYTPVGPQLEIVSDYIRGVITPNILGE